jgi:hypothetical protein
MGADLDFWGREWLVIDGAPHLFFGGITALIVPLGLLIWFLVNWAYRHRFAAKDDQLAARDERLTHAKEKQQDAERKSIDLQFVIEKLEAQLQETASVEDIAVTVSSAKTKAGELVVASNAVSSAIAGIDDSFSKTPLVALRAAQAEIYNKWWK